MGFSGTAALLSRITNLRNVVRSIGGSTSISPIASRNVSVGLRSYSVDINHVIDTEETDVKPKKKLSKAMKAYLERAREYDEFMKKEITEFQIGKRHLANMMGVDPETFTQTDINQSISYLFPSAIYDKKARPIMEPPEKIFPPRKEAQFDKTGRPYHTLFYTCKPHFYQVLHDIVGQIYSLNDIEDKAMKSGIIPRPDEQINLLGSEWLTKTELENRLLETIKDGDYNKFIAAVDRLSEHPFAFHVKDFIMTFRKNLVYQAAAVSIPELEYTPEGRPYITVKNSRRKTAVADVTVLGKGTGKITINGKDIGYFWDVQSREMVIFPLIFTGLDKEVDVEATVKNGGVTGQSGAIRFGISWALRSFVDANMVEQMRVAGLLTIDMRCRERKKPGQEGARRKFTWKKR